MTWLGHDTDADVSINRLRIWGFYALHAPRKSIANRPLKSVKIALFDQSDIF